MVEESSSFNETHVGLNRDPAACVKSAVFAQYPPCVRSRARIMGYWMPTAVKCWSVNVVSFALYMT